MTDSSIHSRADNVAGKYYENSGNLPVVEAVPSSAGVVLDVGCGAGDNARLLASMGKTVDGITLSETEAETARRWCRQVVVADLEVGLPASLGDQRYDACICSHVLEHLRWPDQLLRQIHSCLTPMAAGPQLVIALPNLMCYKTRIPLFLGRFEYADGGIMDASHFRWFTFESGRRLLESSGFTVLRSFGTGHFPLALLRRVLPRRLSASVDSFAVKMRPGVFATQMIFVCARQSA